MTNSDRAGSVGGIVLAGGSSTRLGRNKASLDWHGVPLVERVARLVARGTGGGPVVVVHPHGSAGGTDGFASTSDPFPDAGPLVGLQAGLEQIGGSVDVAVVVPCDLPLLHPAAIRALAGALLASDADVASPADPDGLPLPLPGAWRTSLTGRLADGIESGERSPRRLASRLRFAPLDLGADPELQQADPELQTLSDIDEPSDLELLLSLPPKVRVSRDRRITTLDAWTLGEAASATGGDPEGPCVVNGLPVEFDPRMPLARRDAISLPPAVSG